MTANIKIFDTRQTGAITPNMVAGNLISFLDAALVTGWNNMSVQSIAVSGTTATVVANNHGFNYATWVLFAGANEAQFNNEFRVSAIIDANTFQMTVPAGLPAAATGTLTCKQAPLGWSKPFSGTNLAAYRSTNPASKQHYLRINDTYIYNTQVWGAITMSSINAGTEIYPGYDTAFATANRQWMKGYSNVYRYVLIGNDKQFWLFTWHNNYLCFNTYYFGDFTSISPTTDNYNVMLVADFLTSPTSQQSTVQGNSGQGYQQAYVSNSGAPLVARNLDGLPGTVGGQLNACYSPPFVPTNAWYAGSTNSYTRDMYGGPSAVMFGALSVLDVIGNAFGNPRGSVGGLLFAQCRTVYSMLTNAIYKVSFKGGQREVFTVPLGSGSQNPAQSVVDITGPWD